MITYSSIENHYRTKTIDIIRSIGADKVEWVAMEKLDGANLSLIPGDIVKIASRSQITDGNFYACGPVVEPLFPSVKSIGKTVFGEIFGQGIQKRINYGEKKFAAFDIFDEDYVDYDLFVSLCDQNNIPRCPEIARGSFDELFAMNPEVPTVFGSDISEGFVMKPVKSIRFNNGSRVILKKKNEKFLEKESVKKDAKPKRELSESARVLLDLALPLINENRVISVVSKGYSSFGEVANHLLLDVLDEIEKDGIVVASWAEIKPEMMSKAGPIIRKVLFT